MLDKNIVEIPLETGLRGTFDATLVFIFDLFNDLPFDRFKKCPECEKLFIQKTAKEKIYCSVLCKNRYIVKQKAIEEKKG